MASLVLVHHSIDTLTLVNLSSLYDPLHVHRALIWRRLFEWQKMATGHPVVASSLTKQFGSLEQVCSSVKQVFGAPCTKPWRLTCYRSRRNRPATATSLRTTPPILRRWLAPPGPRPLSPTAISRYSIIHSFEKKNKWIRCCVAKIQLKLLYFFLVFDAAERIRRQRIERFVERQFQFVAPAAVGSSAAAASGLRASSAAAADGARRWEPIGSFGQFAVAALTQRRQHTGRRQRQGTGTRQSSIAQVTHPSRWVMDVPLQLIVIESKCN